VYVNNLYGPYGETAFTDITAGALLATGAGVNGSNHYESTYGDLDGDGDFDVWAVNYDGGGNAERILTVGPMPGLPFAFTKHSNLIKGDPITDEEAVNICDYDGDGDLDIWTPNFSGTNWLFVGGLSQGLTSAEGLYHRSGTTMAGSLAAWPELPQSGNGGTSKDGETGDFDGDGDHDLALSNGGGADNRYMENKLGVPDTHAPTFFALTDQCDKPEGTSTVIHAQVRDNSSYEDVFHYDADLVYSVDGGAETSMDMAAQGSMQFRGIIPPQSGNISWRVEVTDRAGNTGVSSTGAFTQVGPVYTDVGFALPGTSGPPLLTGTGTWEAGTSGMIDLSNARANATAGLFVGLAFNPTPAFGGTLVPVPFLGPFLLTTDGTGSFSIPVASFPKDLPCGVEVYLQYGIDDPMALGGVALTNALQVRTP
jgi:hypothetical protein